jgi:hypothetical protein
MDERLYATWHNVMGSVSPAAEVDAVLDGARLDRKAIEADYRQAVTDALDRHGRGIRLVGLEFVGPADGGVTDVEELKELIDEVDFDGILERHGDGLCSDCLTSLAGHCEDCQECSCTCVDKAY